MLDAVLRRSGGSLIVTIPQAYVEQNQLQPGSHLGLEIAGSALTLRARKVRPALADLLQATPKGLQRVVDWDDMAEAGAEK